MTLWQVDVYPAPGQPDQCGKRVAAEAAELGVVEGLLVRTAQGYLLQGNLSAADVRHIAGELLADAVVQQVVTAAVGDTSLASAPPFVASSIGSARSGLPHLVHVLPKPGVMDPVAQSARGAILDLGMPIEEVATFRKYWMGALESDALERLCGKVLSNESVERVVHGPLSLDHLEAGTTYRFQRIAVPMRKMTDAELEQLSRRGQLYLTLVEMQTIQDHFRRLDRDPTDAELETIAQTWSEHCSHKTLAGRIAYRDEQGERQFGNMLKETIFAATHRIREQWGDEDWCVSVFEDNAGVIRFDDEYHVVFKVETHNHPSALEPYGGANTGLGGVIRDPLGTGLGARPVCNTDVFCFADPHTPADSLPPGVLHPRRIMRGVVAGVRDYGNRMGIPTVNGAVFFDPRYLGNPLVFCGNVGILPVDKAQKAPQPGDYIVALGGRTGRDGIHGATFSSAELTSDSESISGGAVQIGNAIAEKMLLDVLLQARDRGLYHAVTDCGAGGFSSAIGEMGEKIGAVVALDRVPLKYEGLSYTEIWISEAQERMILAVPPVHWLEFEQLCQSEGVEATVLGEFVPSGRLELTYQGQQVADLQMEFLHDGRPPVVRQAVYQPRPTRPWRGGAPLTREGKDWTGTLLRLLGALNICSKEWIIRQYDHEVQGGSVVKPLVGAANDGPGDAAVIRPRLDSQRGLAISCGMNPHYGDHDPYAMAASAIDEAVRNCVAVGADPTRIAILDNFCWGYTDRPETLGTLVRAAVACSDIAVAFKTPFISGKDSLNNEFSYVDAQGAKQTISIPSTLLISALGQVDDVRRCVTMDLKSAGNRIYLVGTTYDEMAGTHLSLIHQWPGGTVPGVRPAQAVNVFQAVHAAIRQGWVRACHDLSEGGLAVAAAEMAFSGGHGIRLELAQVPHQVCRSSDAPQPADDEQAELEVRLLFAESNSRFLCEVAEEHAAAFEQALAHLPCAAVGRVTDDGQMTVVGLSSTPPLIDASIQALKQAWQAPLRWH